MTEWSRSYIVLALGIVCQKAKAMVMKVNVNQSCFFFSVAPRADVISAIIHLPDRFQPTVAIQNVKNAIYALENSTQFRSANFAGVAKDNAKKLVKKAKEFAHCV